MNQNMTYSGLVLLIVMGVTACAPAPPPTATEAQPLVPTLTDAISPAPEETSTSEPEPTPTAAIPVTGHLMTPADLVPETGALINDVESSGSSAPYGDSYRINRFERPFLQDMTYVPELDILSFSLSEDIDWYYLSIMVNGNDLNSSLEIHYGVEIDLNADGFGDYMVWSHPPYRTDWDTGTVQVFEDRDQDTAGRSSRESDVGFDGNGYETLLFDGASIESADPDLAWVRMLEGEPLAIQFAFKKSWIGSSFLVGVVSDGGLRDLSMFDYNDRLSEADAGSPVRSNSNYPLAALYAVDNTCWEPYGFENLAYQPKFCQPDVLPTATRRPPSNNLSTVAPPTNNPPTSEPPTIAPPTSEPPTNEPPTNEPPTSEPPTSEPPTVAPPTACTPDFDPGVCDTYNPEICECE